MILGILVLFLVIVAWFYLQAIDLDPEIEGIQHTFDLVQSIREFIEISGSFVDGLRQLD